MKNCFKRHSLALLVLIIACVQSLCLTAVGEGKSTEPKNDLPTDPQGEWYEVGYLMAAEAIPSFRVFGVSDADLSLRMNRVIETLGADVSSIKTTDMNVLQQGWDDAIAGKKQAMTFPTEQRGSLVPQAMRGFHRFSGSSSDDLADRAAEWKKAVALVRSSGGHGTGFFIGPGLLLTNHHVIDGDKTVEVQLEENKSIRTHKAEVVASQEVPDIALLKIEWNTNAFLPIGDSDSCKELQEIVMIGFPQFDRPAATFVKGHISSTGAAPEELEGLKEFDTIQLNIEAAGGNSGGPIVASNGSVVGVFTWTQGKTMRTRTGSLQLEKNRQFSFAQKINSILSFLEKHAKGKFQRIQ